MKALDRAGTKAYVRHRLRMAGAERAIFSEEALEIIHHAAGGVPRVINTLGDNLLFESWMNGERAVSAKRSRAVVKNLSLPLEEPTTADYAQPELRSTLPTQRPLAPTPTALPAEPSTEDALNEIDRILRSLNVPLEFN